jgi:hypothetical protein
MATVTTSLSDIANLGEGILSTSETTLQGDLATISTSSTASDLLKLQADLAMNSTVTATISGCVKERGDCLKGAAQHIG